MKSEVQDLLKRDRFKEALELIDKRSSELGEDADFFRGQIFSTAEKKLHGFGSNRRKAAAHFERAAENGHPEATYELAKLYRSGEGVIESREKAAFWFGKAAGQGHVSAQFELANFYLDNEDLPGCARVVGILESLSRDEVFADAALLKLGRIYCRGKCGILPDGRTGVAYLEAAADKGNKNALMDLANLYYSGKYVTKDLKRARELAEKAGPAHMLYEEIVQKIQNAIDVEST